LTAECRAAENAEKAEKVCGLESAGNSSPATRGFATRSFVRGPRRNGDKGPWRNGGKSPLVAWGQNARYPFCAPWNNCSTMARSGSRGCGIGAKFGAFPSRTGGSVGIRQAAVLRVERPSGRGRLRSFRRVRTVKILNRINTKLYSPRTQSKAPPPIRSANLETRAGDRRDRWVDVFYEDISPSGKTS
jgi:hypothetical protein